MDGTLLNRSLEKIILGNQWRALSSLGLLIFFIRTSPCHAAEQQFEARLDTQFYAVPNSINGQAEQRERVTTTVVFSTWDIGQSKVGSLDGLAGSWRSRVQLRLNSDFALPANVTNPNATDQYIPGIANPAIDLSYGYVEGTGLFGVPLTAKIGRLYWIEPLSLQRVDGIQVDYYAGSLLNFSVFGGIDPRRGSTILSVGSAWQSTGVFRGNRQDMPQEFWPEFLNDRQVSPSFGTAVHFRPSKEIDTHINYGIVLNNNQVITAYTPSLDGTYDSYGQLRIGQNRLVAGANYIDEAGLQFGMDARFDFYVMRISRAEARIAAPLLKNYRAEIDISYDNPVFDADSVFNWFYYGANSSAQLLQSIDLDPITRLDMVAGGRLYGDDLGGSAFSRLRGTQRYLFSSFSGGLEFEDGTAGHRIGADIGARHRLDKIGLDLHALGTVYNIEDVLGQGGNNWLWNYVLGLGYEFFGRNKILFDWEQNFSERVGEHHRLTLSLVVGAEL